MKEGSEESVLKIYANVLFYVGVVCSAIIIIAGIILAVNVAQDVNDSHDATLWFILVFIASIILAALLFVPFLLEWAFVHVYAKMSGNISSTNDMVRMILRNVEEMNTKPETKQPVQNKTTTIVNKQEPVHQKEYKQDTMTEVAIMEELAKGDSQADKLCKLMELRDEGMISQETYDRFSAMI